MEDQLGQTEFTYQICHWLYDRTVRHLVKFSSLLYSMLVLSVAVLNKSAYYKCIIFKMKAKELPDFPTINIQHYDVLMIIQVS
jgi:hypothetical protein